MRIAYMLSVTNDGPTMAAVAFIQDSTTPANNTSVLKDLVVPNGASAATVYGLAEAAIAQALIDNSLPTVDSFIWMVPSFVAPAGLASAPQAAIADAPTDAVTNYNVVTTLLGSLTGAVNTANTKQNDIATKLNSLLTELRTLGLISA